MSSMSKENKMIKTGKIILCKICGKWKYISRGVGTYCSNECKYSDLKEIRKLSKHPRCKICHIFLGKNGHICRTKALIEKNCLYCNKTIFTIAAEIKRGHGKFCSRKCRELSQKGKIMVINYKAEKSSMWKGDKVSYKGLHKWVGENLGKPDICKHCGKSDLTGRWIHWANISGLYLRKATDWIRLCAKCHKKFDKKDVKEKRESSYLETLT